MDTLVQLQADAVALANAKFGREGTFDFVERSRRALEEAAELAQSTGVSETDALRIIMHVYSRKVGEPQQELAGLMFCVLLAANALGLDLERSTRAELDRFGAVPQDMVQAKLALKKAAGISDYGG